MTKPIVATKLSYVLWATAGASVVLLVLSTIPAMSTRLNHCMLAAESLLTFVLAVEGLVAVRELTETRRQLRFDAVLKLVDFSRELHSLAFTKPNLWRALTLQTNDSWDEEKEKQTRYIQLFMNLTFLNWEADQHGYYEKNRWQEDATDFIRRPATREFWKTHFKFYSENFRKWVDGVLQG